MATYILLTKLSPEATKDFKALDKLGKDVTEKIRRDVPEAQWKASYSILGPYDYLDLFEAPNEEVAARVSAIIRTFGHATTETWLATPYDRFIEMVKNMPS
jgi:uncharacterized protein with GYD domain